MTPLDLPADVHEFLTSGRQLSYDPETCEAGIGGALIVV